MKISTRNVFGSYAERQGVQLPICDVELIYSEVISFLGGEKIWTEKTLQKGEVPSETSRASNKTQAPPPLECCVLCSGWNTEIHWPFKPQMLHRGDRALHRLHYSSACRGPGFKSGLELPGILASPAPVPWGIQLSAVLLKRKRDTVVTLLLCRVQGWKRAIGMGWWQEIAWAASVTSQANGERACRSTEILPLEQAVLQAAEELFTCSADCLWPIWIWRGCLTCSLLWSLSFWVKAQRCY